MNEITKEQEEQFFTFFDCLHKFMVKNAWYGACHATTAMMYAFAKKIGIEAIPCIGECKQNNYPPFDHSWLLINDKIYDLAISLPFVTSMALRPVYKSIDSKTNKKVDMYYGISFLGLSGQASFIYNQDMYEYMYNCSELNLINLLIDISKNSKVYITRKWLEKNLSNNRFVLIAS